MAGHALPPPAPVVTGPTMRVIVNGRQAIQSLKAAKILSWPSSPPFFFSQMNSNHQLWNPPCILENKRKWLYKAPQAPAALYIDKHLKLAFLTRLHTFLLGRQTKLLRLTNQVAKLSKVTR